MRQEVDASTIPAPEPGLTPHEIVARADAMRPTLLEQQEETEARTYYSESTHEAFLEAGFYRVLQPRRFGGYEFDVPTFYRVIMAVARGCPSTGWCLSLASAHSLQMASLFPEQAQSEVFAPDGEFRAAMRDTPRGTAVPVDGGYMIDGTWDYCSGAPYSTHFGAGATTIEDPHGSRHELFSGEEVFFVLPRSEWTMLDDWRDSLGLRGSGSHSIKIENVFVPEHRVIRVNLLDVDAEAGTAGSRVHSNPMYSGRQLGFFDGELASIIIGAAKAALDEYEDIITSKKTTFPPHSKRYLHFEYQRVLGLAMGMIDTAEAAVLHLGEMYMEYCRRAAGDGVPFSREEDFRLDGIAVHAGRLAWDATELMVRTAGSSPLKNGQRMQRYFRDMATYRGHQTSSQCEILAAATARIHLGLPMWTD